VRGQDGGHPRGDGFGVDGRIVDAHHGAEDVTTPGGHDCGHGRADAVDP
jgi:hypothetical protein